MGKTFFQDMVKIKNENREKLKPKAAVKTPPVVKHAVKKSPDPEPDLDQEPSPYSKFASVYEGTPKSASSGRSRRLLWFVAGASALFLFFAFSFLFSRAEVTVNPKIEDITLNDNLSATKDSNEGGLSFDLVVISGEETKMVEAKTQKEISLPAKGTVIIYNNFSSASQGLDIDTRLEGSNGKIYKTEKRIIVPGKSGNTPGAIEVNIYASSPGVDYNSGPLDFKIFGFKGTPKYDKFYGRSKGELTGGFKGAGAVVSDEDKAAAVNALRDALEAKLLKNAKDQIPSGFVLFPKAVNMEMGEVQIPFVPQNNMLSISQKGTLYGILLDEAKLTQQIAKKDIENYDEGEVYISNIEDLDFALSPASVGSFADMKNINFNLSGSAKIVWKTDTSELTSALLGKPKGDFNKILAQYPDVDSALLKLSPPWIWSIPSKSKDIKVIVNYPK